MNTVWKALCALVAPSATIQEPENRRRALLLNTLLLIYLVSVWAMVATVLEEVQEGHPFYESPHVFTVTIGSAILFSFFYVLAKTRYYLIAGICFCLTIDLGIVAAVMFSPIPRTHPSILPYLIIPVLIAMFVLPLRSVLAIGFASLACALVITTLQLDSPVAITFSMWFFLIALALVLAGSLLRSFDLKQMEDERLQLFHVARMSTLGEMAGGIAHEVNNPVAVIQLRASQALRVLKKHPDEAAKVVEFLEAIKRTASHIETVVRGLRSF